MIWPWFCNIFQWGAIQQCWNDLKSKECIRKKYFIVLNTMKEMHCVFLCSINKMSFIKVKKIGTWHDLFVTNSSPSMDTLIVPYWHTSPCNWIILANISNMLSQPVTLPSLNRKYFEHVHSGCLITAIISVLTQVFNRHVYFWRGHFPCCLSVYAASCNNFRPRPPIQC
jgi:hypothetical protein